MKYKLFYTIILVFLHACGFAQTKQEKERRIDKKEFPDQGISLLKDYLKDVKRVRYYKETDGEKTSYEVKFKKDRLLFSIEFDTLGNLEDVEFIIKKIDIPSSSLEAIQNYLGTSYQKAKIKKIQQQYVIGDKEAEQLLKQAFQNLLLPFIKYEIIISAKEEKGYQYYEITFDSEGNHLNSRRFSSSNYDHVLY